MPLLEPLLILNALQVPNKSIWFTAFTVWLANDIDFTDAFNVASMQHAELTDIYAWDQAYDKVPGVTRIEPSPEKAAGAA